MDDAYFEVRTKDGTCKYFDFRCNYIKPFCGDHFVCFMNRDPETKNDETLAFINVDEIVTITRHKK